MYVTVSRVRTIGGSRLTDNLININLRSMPLDSTQNSTKFAIVGMRTDDTMGLSTSEFSEREDTELTRGFLNATPKLLLSSVQRL
ncbi:hypothetical protein CMUS01_16790 [Colletotrichum musicola]|uniref:Uncharacterized protein n=1 Tax=Colletotrichum musicola TaxID=2175873 RepID=A0A8H6IK65_9PEZI|nr:hypothetical protein CMUS01_16790 [Colletotrichum musicola]